MMRALVLVLAMVLASAGARAAELPIFDAHIHYSHDAADVLPAKEAIAILRKAGVKRALVSSSGDDGTQRLVELAPDLIIAELRPYPRRGLIGSWVRDPKIIDYIEERLAKFRYVAIGEFHAYGGDADLPVVRKVIELARKHNLFLHAHSDAEAIERIFKHDPKARILWAHAGFEPPEKVRALLRRHKTLWCDLAYRTDHAADGKVTPAWRAAFVEFPDRFMVGTDTFTPERWHYVGEHASYSRSWLKDLPADVAARIAHLNGEALFGSFTPKTSAPATR